MKAIPSKHQLHQFFVELQWCESQSTFKALHTLTVSFYGLLFKKNAQKVENMKKQG